MAAPEASGASSASLTTRADAGEGTAGEVALWLQAIDLAGREEADWRKSAGDAERLYRAGKATGDRRGRTERFNILYANTETLAPATYNSLPIPDIRRRFGEADPVSKAAATVLERNLSFSMEQQDFDGVLQRAVKAVLLVGRGVARVKYKPTFGRPSGDDVAGEAGAGTDADDGDDAYGDVLDETTCSETVSWTDFRHGPGKTWGEVPWIAFRHILTRDELKKLAPRVAIRMPMDARVPGMDEKNDKDGQPPADLFLRAVVWEVWDKEKRKVLFVAPGWPAAPLKKVDDPLGLRDFYPLPKPIYAIEALDDLTPVEPYRLYKPLAEELNTITRRLAALVAAMRWRGAYSDVKLGDFLTKFKDLGDGEMAPIENPSALNGDDVSKLFWFMPIDVLASVIDRLYAAREQVKQSIYEVTGIADIVRGATKATETATAQQLKSQWGNLRIQHLQAEVARFARDLLRLEAEIMAEKFAPETLLAVAGMELPSEAEVMAQVTQQMAQMQPPQVPGPAEQAKMAQTATTESVTRLLRDDAQRRFRIDIETDSTIRADVQRAQENITGFVTGFGAFIQAIGPAVQQGALPMKVASEMVKSFSRAFKLGRSVEDALEEMPTEQPPQADPAAAAAEAEKAKAQTTMQVEQMKLQAQGQAQAGEMQVRAAEAQAQQQADAAKLQADGQAAQMQAQVALQSKEMELQAQLQVEQARLLAEDQRAAATLAWEREKFEVETRLKQTELQMQADLRQAEIAANAEAKRHATETGYAAKSEATEANAAAKSEATKAAAKAAGARKAAKP